MLGIVPPPYSSEFRRLCSHATDDDFKAILERVAHEGSQWEFQGNARILRTCYLKPEANVWFYFLRHTLLPTAHDTNLCMLRIIILYCIMEGHGMDVGRLISNNILGGADRANARMSHPTIIHSLMNQAKVPVLSTDRFSKDKLVMDKMNVDRLLRNNAHLPSKSKSDSFAPLEATLRSFKKEIKVALREHQRFITAQIAGQSDDMWTIMKRWRKEDRDERNTWLMYEKAKDDAMRRIWSKDHPEIVSLLPKFPMHLLWHSVELHPTHPE